MQYVFSFFRIAYYTCTRLHLFVCWLDSSSKSSITLVNARALYLNSTWKRKCGHLAVGTLVHWSEKLICRCFSIHAMVIFHWFRVWLYFSNEKKSKALEVVQFFDFMDEAKKNMYFFCVPRGPVTNRGRGSRCASCGRLGVVLTYWGIDYSHRRVYSYLHSPTNAKPEYLCGVEIHCSHEHKVRITE